MMVLSKAYLTIHQFPLKEWNIAHLGFLQGYNIMHVSKHQTKLRLLRETQEISQDTPQFEIANSRVRSGQGEGPYHCTQAYEIQCPRANAVKLMKILQSGLFRKSMAFVPYSLKKHKPAAFLKAIQLQNKNLSETWVIKIQGFSHEALDNCRQTLLSQPGVNTITPTPRNIEKGEWKILIARNHLPTYYQWLKNKMDLL